MSQISVDTNSSSSFNFHQCKCRCPVNTGKMIVASAGCSDDRAAVATLPDHWVPKRSGPILANYLKLREQNHNSGLKELYDKAADINGNIESKVRELAEQLLATIQQNDRDIDCIVDSCNTGKGPLSTDARNEALRKVSQLYNDRVNDLATFKRDASCLERERGDELKKLLTGQFQKLNTISHLTPNELHQYFDDLLYETNQQLLSNFRAYDELEASLRTQADESVTKARSVLNQLCLGISLSRSRSAHPRITDEIHSTKRSMSATEKIQNSLNPVITEVLETVEEEIDACVTRMVDAYRSAVLKVFSGFLGKLSDLHKSLTNCNIVQRGDSDAYKYEVSDLMSMVERTLRRLSSSVHKKVPISRNVFEITQNDTIGLQKSLWALGERLQDTFHILHDAGHLFDAHMLRSALAQKLTMAAVEDLLSNNDTIELANEVTFNIALELLRSSQDLDKLQNQYDVIVVMLQRTAEMYLSHNTGEINRLEEFLNLPSLMANTLLAEINCFLENNPRSPLTVGTPNPNEIGTTSPVQHVARRSILPRAILQTGLQELALLNWRNGFLETFESNLSLVADELMFQARTWVDERAKALHMRYSLKMVSHSIRLERVKAARDIRLAELQHHETRLDSHLNAIYDLVDDLPTEASDFLSLEAKELYPICEWVDRIQSDFDLLVGNADVDPEVKSLKMNSYASRLCQYRRHFEGSVDVAIQGFKNYVEQRVQEGRVSNVRFISQICLFSEGGRYASAEALKASVALMKGNDALEVCNRRTLDALNHRRTHLLALADQRLLPIQKAVEEYVKVTTKYSKITDKKSLGKPVRKR